jgi:molybdate transport system ATP-binding protein
MIELDIVIPRLFAEGATELEVHFALESGSLTALVGPSGSGKTTILRVLAGLDKPRQGQIRVDENIWFDTRKGINQPSQKRSIGYVFQDTALFPNMTVRENILFAASTSQRSLVDELIQETGLAPFAHQKPTVLSGGQRQRVALARALVRRPALLLLDEPFAALDPEASQQLRQLLLKLHHHWKTTTLLVSHYETDVQVLADRVIRIAQGRIQSDQANRKDTVIPTHSERIRRIHFDENQQEWVIETDTILLRSANSAWSQFRVDDFIRVSTF